MCEFGKLEFSGEFRVQNAECRVKEENLPCRFSPLKIYIKQI